jgi:ligand-binding sensor domain-containing protein/signal transduction histidine kinase
MRPDDWVVCWELEMGLPFTFTALYCERRQGVIRLQSRLFLVLLLSLAACGSVTVSALSDLVTARSPISVAQASSRLGETGSGGVSQVDGILRLGRVPNKSIRFERILVEQGLSQNTVNCILQDSKGFIWFGTEDGLNKYDGYKFTVYRHDPKDPHTLSDNTIRTAYEDHSGVLWVGTGRGGLNAFDRVTEKFTHYRHDPDNARSLSYDTVTAVYEDSEGVLWVGTWRGLNRFDREREEFVRYRFRRASYRVTAIYEDESGVLWVGTSDGLARFDRETGEFVHYENISYDVRSLSNNMVRSIWQDRDGVLWVGTGGGGLNRFDWEKEQFTHYLMDPGDTPGFVYNDVTTVYEDQAGVLWVGTDGGGLYQFDREMGQFDVYRTVPHQSDSLSSNYIRSIYQDRQGVLWIGTWDGGVNKYDWSKEKFVHYQNDPDDSNSLSHNHVLSILEDRDGVLWIGTSGRGLDGFDRVKGTFTHYRHNPRDSHSLSNDYVTCLYQDIQGVIWVGTRGGGLNRLDPETGQFVHYQNTVDDSTTLSSDVVEAIHQDRVGTLWVGTMGGGLNRFDAATEQFSHYRYASYDSDSLSSDNVTSIYEDRWGMLWIGTEDGGLDRFDRENERFVRYQSDPGDPNSLSGDAVSSLYEDQVGILWVGTDRGLNRFDQVQGTFTWYDEQNGLPSDVVSGILGDGRGFLWLSTTKGLSRFDPRTETFRNYGVDDGLQGYDFGAYHKGRSGEMFFGGVNGLNAFYPDDVRDNPYVPPIVLTRLTQGGERVSGDTAVEAVAMVTLRWPKNFFEFEFAALNYVQPEKNQYAYMLEGFDKDWNSVGSTRSAQYTDLPGGTYTLRLKGSNNDGVWNDTGVSLTIVVVPPFWMTWWFRGAVVLALIGSVVGGYWLRVRSFESRTRELATLVEQRTHEIDQRRQELEALYLAENKMHRHLHLDQVLQALVDVTVDILQADKSAVFAWDEQRERLVVRVARGFSREGMTGLSFAQGEGAVGCVAASGEPAIVEDWFSSSLRTSECAGALQIIDSEQIRSFMYIPIKVGSEVFGIYNVSFVKPHAFGDEEQRLFLALTQRAALAIENAQLYEQTQELAVVEERNRLARDLHDAVTQTLFSASLIAETLPDLWSNDQGEGRQLLAELRQLNRGALAEMRTLLLELRPATLTEASLGDLLRQLGEAVTGRTGVPVKVAVDCRHRLPSEVHVALYRIAQEALNNVVKHARAREVEVRLRCISDSPAPRPELTDGVGVELCICDDGCGFDLDNAPSDHLGLGIMHERAQAVGAILEIKSQPGSGTQVVVTWGLDK